MTKQATLRDVARRASCSSAVVSTVVNGSRGNTVVSAAMRERVMRAAAELGYRSNFAGRSLLCRRTRTFGIYTPPTPWTGLGYAYDDTILRGVEAASRDHDYDLLLINLTSDQAPDACLDKFAEGRIDGLILIHIDGETPWIGKLLSRGCHVVAVDYTGPDPRLNAVVFDNHAVSRMAVEHLVALVHRHIGFVGTCRDPLSQDSLQRQEGFLQAMAARGLPVRPEWVFDPHLLGRAVKPAEMVCQTEGREAVRHLLTLGATGPTAWLAHNDLVASTMLVELRTAGRNVPRDLSIIGVDDSETCAFLDPPLTSVRHPLEEMGRRAVDRLVACVEAPADVPEDGRAPFRVVFQPELVARQSTGLAPR